MSRETGCKVIASRTGQIARVNFDEEAKAMQACMCRLCQFNLHLKANAETCLCSACTLLRDCIELPQPAGWEPMEIRIKRLAERMVEDAD